MTDWIVFRARIEPMEWGDAVYTVLHLPADVTSALDAFGARRVEGEIADHPVNLALTRAPVAPGAFLYTGRAFLASAGIEPGEEIDVRLRPADPDAVEVPDDLRASLRASGRLSAWQALSPGRRRALVHGVTSAKRPETRSRRIARLLEDELR